MEAHVKTVREILHSGDQFLVPFFQRHYSWRKEDWQRLLNDIIALTEDSDDTKHFLGPLVCTPFHPVPGEVISYQLIDGQQRLATLSIALAALRDVAKLNSLESLGDEILEDYLIHRRAQGLKRFKVLPKLGDRRNYESIIEGNPAGTTMTTGLLGAYSFFKRREGITVATRLHTLSSKSRIKRVASRPQHRLRNLRSTPSSSFGFADH